MDELYEAYFTLLGKLGEILDQLSALARRKNIAAQRGDVLTVNECMKEEQSLGLTMRRLDNQREKLLAALGLSGVPLSGLAAACPVNQRQAARTAAENLLTKCDIYRSASEGALASLECSLHNVEKNIEANVPGGMAARRPHSGLFTDFRT